MSHPDPTKEHECKHCNGSWTFHWIAAILGVLIGRLLGSYYWSKP